jgi:hypothetical protein
MKIKILFALIGLVLIFSGCISGPSLVVENVQGEDNLGLTQGCYSTISGNVKNNGNATAQGVIITCSTTQQGGVIGTQNKDLGSINSGSSVPFTVDVDTDCLKGDVTYNCITNCENC